MELVEKTVAQLVMLKKEFPEVTVSLTWSTEKGTAWGSDR